MITEKVTTEQTFKDKRKGSMDIQEKSTPRKGKSQCKDPRKGVCTMPEEDQRGKLNSTVGGGG